MKKLDSKQHKETPEEELKRLRPQIRKQSQSQSQSQ